MLKPSVAPLECYGLSYHETREMCRSCPHVAGCHELMGDRINRIPVSETKFCLVPEGFVRRTEEPNADFRDIESIYIECWEQVYGPPAEGNVGKFREQVFALAKAAHVSVPLFVLVSMFAHSKTYPGQPFSAGKMVDGRALTRVKTYTAACFDAFGAVNPRLLDAVTDGDLDKFRLDARMLKSEALAGQWLIDYNLWEPGLPFEAMLLELENELDPYWLAVEKHYEPIRMAYAEKRSVPPDAKTATTRHDTLVIYQHMKKHKHSAISNFRTREKIMPDAVIRVLSNYGYQPSGFEITNAPVTDPLLFWHRLAQAIQHMEWLLFVNYGEGIYARA